MSIRFDAAIDAIARTTNLPDYNATYTLMGWFYLSSDTNDIASLFYLGTTTGSVYDYLGTAADGTTLTVYVAGLGTAAGSALSVATWTHVALVRASPTSLQ